MRHYSTALLMPLSQEAIVRTLFSARSRLSAGAWLVVRDAQAAEDIFQNVSIKALTKNVVFEHEAQLLSWASVTTRHESIDWLRRHSGEALTLDDALLETLEAEWAEAPAREGVRLEALRDCLEKAPHAARHMLELRYFEGRSCEEVSQAVGIGLAALYQRLSRLHRALKICVERQLGQLTSPSTP